jgi:hypothetical protein
MDELLGPIRANWTRYLYAAAVLPLRVAWLPLSYLVAVLKALFAPAGYVLAYIGTWIVAIANFLVSLEVHLTPICPPQQRNEQANTHSRSHCTHL